MSKQSGLSHIAPSGEARMVDVTHKQTTARYAVACARIVMAKSTLEQLLAGNMKKGDVFAAARFAGVQGAKQCPQLIPLCHTLNLSDVKLEFETDLNAHCVNIKARCRTKAQTGVEMEALTAVSVAALTIYDMCKAVDREMCIEGVCLLEKRGGHSDYVASM